MLPENSSDDLDLRREPPTGIGMKRYEITRTPDRGRLCGLVLSEFVMGKETHWAGQTVPCGGKKGCAYCDHEMASDWHSYFFAYHRDTQVIFLVEITRGPLQAFRAYEDSYGKCRGAVFSLQRKPQRSNGRVVAEVIPSRNAGEYLPPCPDIDKVLKRIWSGGRLTPAEKAAEILEQMEQKTFAHGVPGVEAVVEEAIKRSRSPQQQPSNRKGLTERYEILKGVADSLNVNGHKKKGD